MEIRKIDIKSPYINQLIDLSIEWEKEDSCQGYISNNIDTFKDKEIYVMLHGDKVIAYLFGYFEKSQRKNTVQNLDDVIFEVDELFVIKEYRNKGIGKELYEFVENDIRNKTSLILLSTATKDYKKILHFYIDELGLTFWNARLFKRLK